MTFRVSETLRATGEAARTARHRELYVCGWKACDQGRLSQADRTLIRIKPELRVHVRQILRISTAPGSSPISTRCAPSAPTRPACTSRPFPSRICARCNGWCSGFPRPGLPVTSTASAMCSAPARNPDRNCWRARISKARILPVGSMDRLASSTRWKPPASSIRIRASTGQSKSLHGATRRDILAPSSAPGLMSAASPRLRSTPRATAAAAKPCATRCATSVLPAGRASRLEPRAPYRISRGAYRAGPDAGERRACDRRRHLDRRHLAIPHHIHRRAKSRRHHPDGRPQGCRPGAGKVLRRDRRPLSRSRADRARYGPPAASRWIPVRRASSRELPKCCSRSATMTPL